MNVNRYMGVSIGECCGYKGFNVSARSITHCGPQQRPGGGIGAALRILGSVGLVQVSFEQQFVAAFSSDAL